MSLFWGDLPNLFQCLDVIRHIISFEEEASQNTSFPKYQSCESKDSAPAPPSSIEKNETCG